MLLLASVDLDRFDVVLNVSLTQTTSEIEHSLSAKIFPEAVVCTNSIDGFLAVLKST